MAQDTLSQLLDQSGGKDRDWTVAGGELIEVNGMLIIKRHPLK